MTYQVVLRRTEEGISVSVPGLPGCRSGGDTEEEALTNIAAAIAEHLAALKDLTRGEDVREVEVVQGIVPTISNAARSESQNETDNPANPEDAPRDDWERGILGIGTDCGFSPPSSSWTSDEMYD